MRPPPAEPPPPSPPAEAQGQAATAGARAGPAAGGGRGGGISPWLILVVPPLCWAGNFVVGRAMHADVPPAALTFWRWAVAAAVLLPFAGADLWRQRAVVGRHWRLLAVLTATGVIAFQFFVYRGLHTTTAINGALIIASIPVAIPLVAFLLDGTRISRRQGAGIALSMLGVAVVILRGDPRSLAALQLTPGDGWMFLAVPAWALYSVLVKRTPARLPPLAMLLVTALMGLLALAPAYALEQAIEGRFAVTWETLATFAYIGVFASVVAFACWNRGVAQVGAARAGPFIHLMPIFAAILAIAFLGERVYPFHGVGIAAVALGLWLSSTTGRRREPPPPLA